MQYFLRTLLLAGFCLISVSGHAQIVRIGPWGEVRVRVRFVNVDVSPFGGTHVRAPFVDIATPGYGYLANQPAVVERRFSPAYSESASSASPPTFGSTSVPYNAPPLDEKWLEWARDGESLETLEPRLFDLFAESCSQLYRDLGNIQNGSSLRSYLNVSLIDGTQVRQLSAEQLDKMILNFDALNRTGEFASIAQWPSFQATRARLHYIRRLVERRREAASMPEEIIQERRAF